MRRIVVAGLIVPIIAFSILQPSVIRTLQSPIATPEPALTSPLAPRSTAETDGPLQTTPAVSPVIWILGGLVLGGIIILIIQRTSLTDDR